MLYPPEGLKPNEDYKPLMSGGTTSPRSALLSGDYDMAGVASDVYERMVTRGTLKGDDFRDHLHQPGVSDLVVCLRARPSSRLAKKIRACFFAFGFPPSMQKEFNGDDRFFPITYKDTWKLVREIAEASGTPYNKTAFEAEAKRKANVLKQQHAAPKQ